MKGSGQAGTAMGSMPPSDVGSFSSIHPVLFLVLFFFSGLQPCPDPPSLPLPFWNHPSSAPLACQHPHPQVGPSPPCAV